MEFIKFYGILLELKYLSFKSQINQPDQLAVDRTSGRSTGPVDRCARERAHGQPTRLVDRAVD